MNDFEKIFSDKLHHHKTPPPANGWDQLNAALNKEQQAKKKFIYWRVAAAILLLFLAGGIWWSRNTHIQELPIANETPVETNEPKEVNENPSADSGQLALEEDKTSAEQYEKQASGKQKVEAEKPLVPAVDHKTKKAVVEKKQIPPAPQAQSTLASTDKEVADSISTQQGNNIQTLEMLAVRPLALAESEPIAMENVKAKVSTPVTIIYKPGTKPSENNDKNVALEFLSELRNTNISFSEIRNAKAELLAKVFSKKENEVTP